MELTPELLWEFKEYTGTPEKFVREKEVELIAKRVAYIQRLEYGIDDVYEILEGKWDSDVLAEDDEAETGAGVVARAD